MKLYVCAVLDKKVIAFMNPMFFRTKGEATRSFVDAVSGDGPFKKHAEDYVFMFLGMYDDSSGQFENSVNGPEVLMTALDCVCMEGLN